MDFKCESIEILAGANVTGTGVATWVTCETRFARRQAEVGAPRSRHDSNPGKGVKPCREEVKVKIKMNKVTMTS